MGLIEWTALLSVGIETIDTQHRHLIELINRLDNAASEGRGHQELEAILQELEAYTKEHFSLEEAAFATYGYPEAAMHKAEHQAFVSKLEGFRLAFEADTARVDQGLLGFLKAWLTKHISFADRRYKPFLNGKL